MNGHRPWSHVALLAAALLLTAACAAARVPNIESLAPVAPLPPDAAEIRTPPQGPGEGNCDVEASLSPRRRAGALPPALAAIAGRKLRVGVDQNTYLFGFRDPSTAQLAGFDIDLAGEIARDLTGDPNRVELRSVTAQERTQALQNKQVDVVVRTFTATCERRRDLDFSTVYYYAEEKFLVPKGSGIGNDVADIAGKRVCVLNGSSSVAAMFALPRRPVVIGATSWTDCLVALQQGQVEAIFGDVPILAGLVAQDHNLEIVGRSLGTGAYAVGIAKGNEDLVRFVNGVLERVRADGTWQSIYGRHLSALGPPPAPPQPKYSG
ncbi:glutamate ABC transporter substrate-binding protein [Nocardia panacis]|uniref:Glutamate ABC transporter substrate-binding protein n=1 Tax=Nocardia panacis TaxID=2340916 RepID=A0A3A4KXH5_9NOCA|nr:glutamate ABC transporter substrate-binding protein [Nocardia panacis]RJO78409.1 glutamate ABC transporter substrate-binding protein [Nocardia panacis]